MKIADKLPWIACIVAFILAGSAVIGAVSGPIIILPFALIPLAAGVGILLRRVWSAYGFALYCFAQLVPFTIVLFRNRGALPKTGELVGAAGISIILGCLFMFAGRSLANSGARRRGWPAPWVALAALSTVPLLFLQPFLIPTAGMEDSLLIGDRLLVQRFPMPAIRQGDMIVFVYPVDRRQTFVKRVVGVPGDRIRIANKTVYRNGMPLSEPYATHKTGYEDSYRDNFPGEPTIRIAAQAEQMLKQNVRDGEVVVPPGSYFVLGDNRDNSLDSRYWGFVGFGDVLGKPLLIYDSEKPASEEIVENRPSSRRRTRWERIFNVL